MFFLDRPSFSGTPAALGDVSYPHPLARKRTDSPPEADAADLSVTPLFAGIQRQRLRFGLPAAAECPEQVDLGGDDAGV